MDQALTCRNNCWNCTKYLDWNDVKQALQALYCNTLVPPLEGGIVPNVWLGFARACLGAHSRKDRPPHTGHLGPWDLTSVPAAGWSPGQRKGEYHDRLCG